MADSRSSRAAGAEAERLAADWLGARGFRLLEMNYTCKGGEIDLVCDQAGTLVFVEVRARRGHDYGTPEETVTAVKQRRIVLAARHYLARRGVVDRPCRFDVVAVEGGVVRHIEGAFEATS